VSSRVQITDGVDRKMHFNLFFLACFLSLCVQRISGVDVVEAYISLLATHPLKTNMATASALTMTSDAIAQSIERRNRQRSLALTPKTQALAVPRHDFHRTLSMGFYGATVLGAFVSQWFKVLSRICPVTPGDWASIVRKVGVNQVVISPFLNALFFAWVTFTRNPLSTTLGTKLSMLQQKLNQDLLPTYIRSCAFWVIFNLMNFGLVDAKWQVVVANVGFLAWTVYLSLVGYRAVKKQS